MIEQAHTYRFDGPLIDNNGSQVWKYYTTDPLFDPK